MARPWTTTCAGQQARAGVWGSARVPVWGSGQGTPPIRQIRRGASLCYITLLSRSCDLPRIGRRLTSASSDRRSTPMHVIRRRGWEIPESRATPEHLFLNRRAFLTATGAAAITLSPELALAQRAADLPDPTASLYPVKRNEKYTLDRPVTDEKINTNYNNFYEFSSTKTVARAAQALKLRPWTIKLDRASCRERV